ncbi:hypothetical protein NLO413_0551 [Candidatus Neoehrlichia lotoris str. RAC413]|uniref:Uncharacterized protein n=1 Tax=Candidatus Neoehrlichia procyonis str. RAC413 TaxID=1359163 RepID=A0A0F3NQK9_9RICK|nr:hypothetical protein NLO413_0551 [Candidatus Neoehrlichia lotoris str. RAC413]
MILHVEFSKSNNINSYRNGIISVNNLVNYFELLKLISKIFR